MQRITPSRPNHYTTGALDRAGHLRADPAALEAALADPASRFVLFENGRPLVGAVPSGAVLAPRPDPDAPWLFLGLRDNTHIFAADLTDAAPANPAPEGAYTDLFALGGQLPADDAALLATAKSLLHWRARNRFCAACGGVNRPERGGHVLRCASCEAEHFPRTDPAVIMLVTRGETCLLGQALRFPKERNWYSTLAGFVEPGESLETAVRREVFEEVGIRVGEVAYHSSQPWPFPASLMLGYYAEALNEDITLQADELRDARWFTREDIANRAALGFHLPGMESIARRLIEDWLAA